MPAVDIRKPARHVGKFIKFDDKAAEQRGRAPRGDMRTRQLKGIARWRGNLQTLQYAKEGYTNGVATVPKPTGVTLRFSRSRHDRRYDASTAGKRAIRKAQRESERNDG